MAGEIPNGTSLESSGVQVQETAKVDVEEIVGAEAEENLAALPQHECNMVSALLEIINSETDLRTGWRKIFFGHRPKRRK